MTVVEGQANAVKPQAFEKLCIGVSEEVFQELLIRVIRKGH